MLRRVARVCVKFGFRIAFVAFGILAPFNANAQVPGPNINVISGTSLPDGDPYLQRQNESTGGVSTRNPLHLLAGANDYRTVDIPIDVGTQEESNGDAWLGLYKSYDGGQTWHTSLLPGYPQDTSAVGLASPLHGFAAGADPTVRAGTHGLFYYSGLAFNRGKNGLGVVFVARLIDNNNDKAKFDNKTGKYISNDPIAYLGAKVIDSGTAGQFADKPWLAVDIPRAGAGNCTITSGGTTQTIKAGNVYISYIIAVGNDKNPVTRMMVARSTDCGVTWSKAIKVSERIHISQGSTLAIDPRNGTLYVAWREIGDKGSPDGILIVKSTDGGQTFTQAQTVTQISPFDQGGSEFTFRTRAFPTMAVDGTGRVYLAWSQRGVGPIPTPPPGGIVPPAGMPLGDARIMLKTSTDGVTWTQARPIDNTPLPGHQIQPVLNATAGKITATFYDFRDDVSRLFEQYISDANISSRSPGHKRHTMDIRVWQADPAAAPVIGSSAKVSQYLTGFRPPTAQNPNPTKEQLQFNAPNLPLYGQGKIAFVGDYMDLFGLNFITDPTGQTWKFNSEAGGPSATYAIWTDNRDVRPPKDGNWTHYTPATAGANVPDAFKSPGAPSCIAGQTGMRNANIYTSRITPGLYVGAPVNTKKDHGIQRSFVVFVQNTSDDMKTFRLTAPAGTSWLQFGSPLSSIDVTVAPRSTTSRTLYITSATGPMKVTIVELELRPKGSPNPTNPKAGGLTASVVLNPDVTNPDVTNPDVTNTEVFNPDVTNPDVTNPDVTNFSATNPDVTNSNIRNPDVTNPDVTNPDVTNPDVTNPDVTNVSIANPDVTNPDVTNPDVTNPDVTNPDVTNPDVTNAGVTNPSLTDVTWTVTNNGTAAGSFAVKPFVTKNAPQGFLKQLILHKSYKTPVTTNLGKAALNDCLVYTQVTNVLLANIVAPDVTNPDVTNPDVTNPDVTNLVVNPDVTNASIWLEPGDSAKITMRVLNPDKSTNPVATKTVTQSSGKKQIVEVSPQFEAAKSATPLVASIAVDTGGAEGDITVEAPLVVTTQFLPDAVATMPYLTAQGTPVQLLAAGGVGTYSWCVLPLGTIPDGTCPAAPLAPVPGLTLNPNTGVISGIPTTAGAFAFTVQVKDTASPPAHYNTQDLFIRVGPFATTDTKFTDEDQTLVFAATDLLANDAVGGYPQPSSLAITSVASTSSSHGSVALNTSTGQITYTPQANYNGPGNFTYTERLTTVYDGTCCYPGTPPPALYPVLSATGTVSLNIVSVVNDPPIPSNDTYSTNEDIPLTVAAAAGILANDLKGPAAPQGTQDDELAQTLTATVITGPNHAALNGFTLNGDGSFTYQPAANYNGPDGFTYRVCDNGVTHGNPDPLCVNATVAFTVVPVNDAPVATPQSVTTAEDTAVTVTLAGTDIESSTLTFAISQMPSHGTLSVTTQGPNPSTANYIYTPTANYNGPDSFTFTVTDTGDPPNCSGPAPACQPALPSAAATVSLTVTAVNDAPIPAADAYSTNEDTPLTIAAPGVLANDLKGPVAPAGTVDTELGQTLTVTVMKAAIGQVTLNPDGSFSYTPTANFNGPDSFSYQVCDNGVTNGVASPQCVDPVIVSLTVTEVNDPPTAVDDVASNTAEDTPLNFAATTLTTNDSKGPANESTQTLTVTAVAATANTHGTVALSNGTITYTPAADYNGPASFSYTVTDDGTTAGVLNAKSATGMVSLTVTAVNDPPIPANDPRTTAEDTALNFAAATLTANDAAGPADENTQTLTLIAVGSASHGTVSLANGTVTYTPAANYNGPDSFTYTVRDNGTTNGVLDARQANGIVDVAVTPVNDTPVAVGDAYTTNEDTALGVDAASVFNGLQGLLFNDSDVDAGTTLTAVYLTNPAHGTLLPHGNGSFSYTPNANYNGPDSFTYQASDGQLTSNVVTVNLTVTAVNDAPSFTKGANQTVTVNAGARSVSNWATALSAGPPDEAGQALNFLVSNDNNALFSTQPAISPSGTLTYAPAVTGSATVTVSLHDSGGIANGGVATSAPQTFTITVTAVPNTAPVAANDSYTTSQDTPLIASALPSGLVSWWRGDNNAVDSMGTNNGVLGGGATFGAGKIGQAFQFPGSGSVAIPDAPSLNFANSFTASAWVNLNSAPLENMVVTKDVAGTAQTNYNLQIAGGPSSHARFAVSFDQAASISAQLGSATCDVGGCYVDGTSLFGDAGHPNGTWRHITGSYDNATKTLRVYLDGVEDGRAVVTTAGNPFQATGEAVLIGARKYPGDGSHIDGRVDEVQLFNRNLSANEVQALAQATSYGAPGVLTNDSDAEGDPLTAVVVANAIHGGVVLNTGGGFTYTPNASYNGPDSFTYRANDGALNSNVATVSITVTAANGAPVANNDAYATSEDTPLDASPANLVSRWRAENNNLDSMGGNNGSSNGNVLFAPGKYGFAFSFDGSNSVSAGAAASLVMTSEVTMAAWIYPTGPGAGQSGMILNKEGEYEVARFPNGTIQWSFANTSPGFTWVDTAYVAPLNQWTHVAVTYVQGLVKTYANGVLVHTFNGAGTIGDFYPGLNEFWIGNRQSASDPSFFQGLIDDVQIFSRGITSAEVQAAMHDGYGVLSNDSDADGNSLTAQLVAGPSHAASFNLAANGSFTYTPAPNYSGPDSFTYKANDGSVDSNVATVNLTVTAVNDAPSFAKGADQSVFSSAGPRTVQAWATSISAGPPDESGQTVSFLVSSNNAALFSTQPAVSPSGTLTYTPALAASGTATVSVQAHDTGGTANSGVDTSAAQTFTITTGGSCAVPTFSFYIPDDVAATATFLATGDFNKDGYLDVAVSDGTFGYVRVFLADVADPGGYNHVDYPTGAGAPNGIVVRDFDGDGNLDMAVAVSAGTNSNIAFFKGSASGAFAATPLTTTVAAGPSFPEGADFNGDGHPDLAVANTAATTISVLLWDTLGGNTNFKAPVQYQSGPSSGINIIVEDFDGNGTLDIATPNVGANTLTILSGSSNGTFGAPVTLTVPSPYLVNRLRKVGDIFGDGKPDLGATLIVSSTPGLQNLSLLRNTSGPGNFSFAAPVEILPESYGVGLFAAADVTGDGKPDLVAISAQLATSNTPASVLVLPGDGTGNFGTPAQYQSGRQNNFEIVDVNGDGKLDVIGVGPFADTFYVLQNTCGTATTSDVSLTMTGPATANAGSTATYTLTVTNNGTNPVNNVWILDYFGTDTFVSAAGSGFYCEGLDSNFVCLLGSVDQQTGAPLFTPLAPGASASVDVNLKVFSGAKTNRATVTAAEADPNNANNNASVTTTATATPLTFTVTNTSDSGAGSLRQAMLESNANAGPSGSPNTIQFNIPGNGPFSIAPTTQAPLPTITTPVVIDGTTQQAFMGAPCTNPAVACPPIIELSGATAGGQGGNGLTIATSGSTVRGLVLNRWGNAAILLNTSTVGGNVIAGNYIGTVVAGNTAQTPANLRGIQVQSPNTIIGGTTAADRNVISGNGANSAIFVGPQVNGTTVITSGAGTIIRGNYIGVGADGTTAVVNGTGNVGGINVQAPNVTIGGTTAGARNVIAQNFGSGIFVGAQNVAGTTSVLSSGTGTLIQGNYVGLKADGSGSSALNNTTGIDVRAPTVTIGGTAAGAGNVISATTAGAGVVVSVSTVTISGVPTAFTTGTGTVIQGNYIGTTPAGTAAGPGNMGNGVTVQVPNVTIGGASLPPSTLGTNGGAGNVISGNGSNGISGNAFVSGTTVVAVPSGMVVQGNYIGTNAAGMAQVANTGTGINASGANSVITGNVSSGNTVNGISISAQTISGTTTVSSAGTGSIVQGNFVGVKADGSGTLANSSIGITIGAPGVTIGGTTTAARNVVSGNGNGTIGGGISAGVSTATVSGVTSVVSTAAGTVIQGNYIGTNPAGTAAFANASYGVQVQAPNVTIGGGAAGAGNLISGNPTGVNVNLTTSGANPNTVVLSYGMSAIVQGNYIGTNAAGAAAIPNSTGISVQAYGAHIGGTTALERNVIAGNGTGVLLSFNTINGGVPATIGSGALIEGNYIGVDSSGNNRLANTSTGVSVTTGTANLPASNADPTNVIAGNVIAGSGGAGLSISGGTTTGKAIVTGNFIGTNAAGASGLGNTGQGIDVSTNGNQIGGACSDTTSACAARNVIAGNGVNGINLQTVSNTLILGNYIGLKPNGTTPLTNGGAGIAVPGSNNTIGPNNVIAGNASQGIVIGGAAAQNNVVKGNFIGTNAAGTQAIGNGNVSGNNNSNGVTINNGATLNTIGGPTAADRNLISGNIARGVGIVSGNNNTVTGNYIGTDVTGTLKLGNGLGSPNSTSAGIGVDTANNTITNNLVSGGYGYGINLNLAASTGNSVRGNKVGTNAAGTSALGNATGGIRLDGGNNTIGGVNAGDGNLVSGNQNSGIELNANGNTVRGNLVGTNAAGTAAIPNTWFGLLIFSNNNTIGGTTAGARNVISGNGFNTARAGLGLFSTASGNVVQGNYIGTDINGTAAIGNAAEGIFFGGSSESASPSNNTIGGTAAGAANIIAFNNSNGVTLMPGSGLRNAIRGNSIFSNTTGPGLGIDLGGNGVTNNDTGDGDTGVNNLQNYPVLSTAPIASGTVTFNGTLNSIASATFDLDFYANASCDPSTFGEGKTWLGTAQVGTDGSGNATFSLPFAYPGSGDAFTATATDASGNTSEFSKCVFSSALVITTASLPSGTVGTPYSTSLAATGGNGSNTWSLVNGSLPSGLTLHPNGVIDGTPTASTPAAIFQVMVADSTGQTATKNLSLTVQPLTVTTTAMSAGRGSHTSTVLVDGRVLVAGGSNGPGYMASAEIYDPVTDTWAAANPMSVARGNHVAVRLEDGRVLVAGGNTNGGYLASAEIFDPSTGLWTTTSNDMSIERAKPAALALSNGRVLVAGGTNGPLYHASADLFDPDTGTWSATGSMSQGRWAAAMTLLPNGRALIVGGWSGSSVLSSEEFDPVGTWGQVANTNDGHQFGQAVTLPDGRAMVAGGFNGLGPNATTEVYVSGIGWLAVNGLNVARYNNPLFIRQDGNAGVAGGSTASGTTASIETYPPALTSNVWLQPGSLVTARYEHTAVRLQTSQIMITGGYGTSGNPISSSELMGVSSPPLVTATVGGPGGHAYRYECLPTTFATGLRGEASFYPDRTELWCGTYTPSVGPNLFAGGGGPAVTTPYNMSCSAGQIMVGVHGTAGNVGWGTIVSSLGVDCQDPAHLSDGTPSTPVGPVGTANTPPFAFSCPVGQAVVGIYGGQGTVLDRVGLVCRVP